MRHHHKNRTKAISHQAALYLSEGRHYVSAVLWEATLSMCSLWNLHPGVGGTLTIPCLAIYGATSNYEETHAKDPRERVGSGRWVLCNSFRATMEEDARRAPRLTLS